jgi:hypothetical protein
MSNAGATYHRPRRLRHGPEAYYAGFWQALHQAIISIINPPANAADFVRFYSENIVQFVLSQKPLDETTWAEFITGLDSLGARAGSWQKIIVSRRILSKQLA